MASDTDDTDGDQSLAQLTQSEHDDVEGLEPVAEDEEEDHTIFRYATVYDSVAGRIKRSGGPLLDYTDNRHLATEMKTAQSTSREMPFSPEEVLFRRKGAPVRYMEDDIYFANEKELPEGGQGTLPESDLLQSVHSYASQFYDRMPVEFEDQGDESVDFRSMDGTALLAFGVLLEEAGKEALGRKGDLVFTEGRHDSSEDEAPVAEPSVSEAVGELSVKSLRRTRQSKKRKMDS